MTPTPLRRLLHVDRGAASIDRALDDELQFHFDMTVRDLVALGMSEADARREADRRFGDVQRARANMTAIDRERVSRQRRAEWWQAIAQDLRYALRGMRLKPGFAIAVVITLGLGIGANATMFGIVDRLLFRAPAYMIAPDRVHRVYLSRTIQGKDFTGDHFQYRRYLDLTQWTHSFDGAAAVTSNSEAIGTGVDAREQRIGAISASTWRFFDAKPVIGRFFSAAEDQPPYGTHVAVLSYAFWQSQYGGARNVVGRRVQIGATIIHHHRRRPEGLRRHRTRDAGGVRPHHFSGRRNGDGWPAHVSLVVQHELDADARTAETRRQHRTGNGRPHECLSSELVGRSLHA